MDYSYLKHLPDQFCQDLKDVAWRTRRWFDVSWHTAKSRRHQATRDYWMLIIVAEGHIRIHYQGNMVELKKLEATILSPGSTHTQKTLSNKALVARLPIVIMQEHGSQPHPLKQLALPRPLPMINPDQAAVDIRELQATTPYAKRKTDAELLLGHLKTESLLYNSLAGAFATDAFHVADAQLRDHVKEFRDYLATNFRDTTLNITRVAQEFDLSRSALQRQFAKRYELPPKQWLHRYRITVAARLLKVHPELTVEAVLQRCGYSSRSLFYAQFLQWKGCPPGQFRESLPS